MNLPNAGMHAAVRLLETCGAARRAGHEVVIGLAETRVTIGLETVRLQRVGDHRVAVTAYRGTPDRLERYSRLTTNISEGVNTFEALVTRALEGAVYA